LLGAPTILQSDQSSEILHFVFFYPLHKSFGMDFAYKLPNKVIKLLTHIINSI